MANQTPYRLETFEPEAGKKKLPSKDAVLVPSLFEAQAEPEKAQFAYTFLFTEAEREAVRALANNPQVQKLVFENTLARMSQIDELMHEEMTGFFRKELLYRYLDLKLAKMTDAQIEKAPLSLAVADMAYLSYYNNKTQLGGDAAITVLASEINPQVKREKCVPFRTGGDEFSFVMPFEKSKAKEIGNDIKEKVSGITLDSDPLAEFQFELPLRIDFGYAALAEGLKGLRQYCSDFEESESCLPQNRNNQIIDFALQIADRRSKVRKIIQSTRQLLDLMGENAKPDSDHFGKFEIYFKFLQKGANISREKLVKIFNSSADSLVRAKIIREHALGAVDQLEAEKTEQILLKQKIVKEIASEDLDLSV